ncbi:HK97 family phage portal protein [Phaeovulum vinaykumarii]|uniref:Phage portal protein, HK97 family n=2 Tax=Phaeovulum vinaykumarii TaxID=407234 RepID=A0A1N7K5Z1_9RHOB|nr:phage portal protein, HK97 family [Phaeovulum vinaykumarii]SOB93237.1 HK97 family phage portal protein [Phaeovulum vinaykumarii]
MRVPAVACAVALIAETVGALPAKLFERDGRESVTDHPAYRLIHDEANPWTSAEALRVELTTDALLHGHGYAVVTRNTSGEPVELHRIDPHQVQVETDDFGEPSYLVQLTDGPHRYPFTDILHVSAFAGASPITLGREAIGLALAFEEHIAKLFANGGKPGGILKTEKTLGDEAKAKLAVSWTAAHGAGRSGGTAILDEGMSYEAVTMTLADTQFAENRLEQIREIARAFRVPPTMLFELTRGTWSNTEEMARQFLQVTLKPWLASWSWAYARCLLTPEERRALYVEFVTDDLTTTDTAARAAAYGQYRSMGAMTANEVRAGLNLPPRADGDTLQNPYTTTGAPPAARKTPEDG